MRLEQLMPLIRETLAAGKTVFLQHLYQSGQCLFLTAAFVKGFKGTLLAGFSDETDA